LFNQIVYASFRRNMKINRLWVVPLGFACLAFCGSLFGQESQGISWPESSRLVWAVVGEGVQIYEAKANPSGGYQWAFQMPEAELKDLSGQLFGKHFAGPGWSANDGSAIVGALPPLKTWTSHDSKNIPWLLVAVKSRSGTGLLDKIDYVVRISTEGGIPPNELPKTEHETARVKYRAIYLFLQKEG
jgi:hypothetical protein